MARKKQEISLSNIHGGRDVYIAVGGGQIVAGGDLPTLSDLRLATFDLGQATGPDGIDYFLALKWDYSLVKTLYGRASELSAIVDWAGGGDGVAKALLLSGEGGVGKTRLAAEAALALAQDGWHAGFLPQTFRDRPFRLKADRDTFLILDYPEEAPKTTEWLMRMVADQVRADGPKVRVLLLSRNGGGAWDEASNQADGRLSRKVVAPLTGLSKDDALGLIAEAAERFAAVVGAPAPDLDGARAWLELSEAHRIPLFAAAAAVHAVAEPSAAFDLAGNALMRDLARREKRRVDNISQAVGLGGHGLGQLLALGVLADGLDEEDVRALAAAGVVEPSAGSPIDRVARTPWWREGRLRRLEPDRPAAAFVDAVLFPRDTFPQGRAELPHWLHLALKDRSSGLAQRLSRTLYDLAALNVEEGHDTSPLDGALATMLEAEPGRVHAYEALAYQEGSFWVASFTAAVTSQLLLRTTDSVERAGLLNNLAATLADLGRREDALDAAQNAVALYRDLARTRPGLFTPNLAGSLNNLANMLSNLGRHEYALDALQEALDLYRNLARAPQDAFTPDLAMSLNNLANVLSDLGRLEYAFDAAQEALDLYRDLARARPDTFTPDLAMSLSNLANRLSDLGRSENALDAAQEAVGLHRDLVRARPDTFTPDLAMSLNNLANRFFNLDRHEEAFDAVREAVNLYRDLARAHPDAFTPNLAGSLNNLAAALSNLSRHEDALDAAREAVGLYRDLARTRPDAFTPKVAMSLNTLANRLSKLGFNEDALDAARESIDLYRDLAHARPDAFMANVAGSLNNLASRLSSLGRREDALTAAQEAVDLYRDLARARPTAFTPDLAGSLTNLANWFSDLGRYEDALAAAEEAVDLYRTLTDKQLQVFGKRLRIALLVLTRTLISMDRDGEAAKLIPEIKRLSGPGD